MKTDRRLIYASENGDRWWLRRADGAEAVILHEPNASSGGRTSETAIGAFLRAGAGGPEHRALLDLIGTLVDQPPAAPPARRIRPAP
ncbi:hypothetical protein, partial [Methylobacterium sp. WL6]|uniref:hypothetical protein n=1 Tax=Methylobacterium sp. WL6 TaxID=2603901 RepID=UPI0011CC93B2